MGLEVSVLNCLRKATLRAKSDVANKLVSMFLHEVSRGIAAEFGLKVNDVEYANRVENIFGANCAFCGFGLEQDRLAVEHLEGMNRIRLGLHVPGNVVLACKSCNREKRRDDQMAKLVLANTGWESFLSHDGERCGPGCKSCRYWQSKWPDQSERVVKLQLARIKIAGFQSGFAAHLSRCAELRGVIQRDVELLYRECQEFAMRSIARLGRDVFTRQPEV
jgi:hypothetical protein